MAQSELREYLLERRKERKKGRGREGERAGGKKEGKKEEGKGGRREGGEVPEKHRILSHRKTRGHETWLIKSGT